nr:hypothetical protein [Micromonospora sp. DSM 115978]
MSLERWPEVAEGLLVEELPWLAWLPDQERRRCVRELCADLAAGTDSGTSFARNLASWRSTAEAWADPTLARDLQGPFDGCGSTVDRPLPDAASAPEG